MAKQKIKGKVRWPEDMTGLIESYTKATYEVFLKDKTPEQVRELLRSRGLEPL